MEKGRDVLIVMTILRSTPAHIAKFPCSCAVRGPRSFPAIFLHSLANAGTVDASDQGTRVGLSPPPRHRNHGAGYFAYIPTNLISITDGQIYLRYTFPTRILPAVDVANPFRVWRSGAASCVSFSCRTSQARLRAIRELNIRQIRHAPR